MRSYLDIAVFDEIQVVISRKTVAQDEYIHICLATPKRIRIIVEPEIIMSKQLWRNYLIQFYIFSYLVI